MIFMCTWLSCFYIRLLNVRDGYGQVYTYLPQLWSYEAALQILFLRRNLRHILFELHNCLQLLCDKQGIILFNMLMAL